MLAATLRSILNIVVPETKNSWYDEDAVVAGDGRQDGC